MKFLYAFALLFCSVYSFGQDKGVLAGNLALSGARIAYVNTDTLEAKYDMLVAMREVFKTRQAKMEEELQRSYQQMQDDASDVQKKAAANTLTQAEYEAAEKRLLGKQKTLEAMKESMTDKLTKDQEAFNYDLKARLNKFLEDYNNTKHYDCILAYTYTGSTVLYIDKRLDITDDVVKGMNDASWKDTNK